MRPIRPRSTCALRRAAHDPAAFALVYDAHAVGLLRFLARRTLDVEAARDLTAETFAVAFRDRRRFRGSTDEEAGAWLYGIARNLLSRYVRNGVVERRATERLGIQIPPFVDGDYERIERLAGLADLRGRLTPALDGLSPEQRDAIRLRIIDELPYSEVAARLDVSEPTARARVSRGVRELGAVLKRQPNIKESLT